MAEMIKKILMLPVRLLKQIWKWLMIAFLRFLKFYVNRFAFGKPDKKTRKINRQQKKIRRQKQKIKEAKEKVQKLQDK